MRRVTFETAKAIKEAGYPQYGHCEDYYNSEGWLVSKFCDMDKLVFPAPPYLEVWLWLWREKKIILELQCLRTAGWSTPLFQNRFFNNQEEAIIAAIEYLVENKLLK